jgi:hypothetical protein
VCASHSSAVSSKPRRTRGRPIWIGLQDGDLLQLRFDVAVLDFRA